MKFTPRVTFFITLAVVAILSLLSFLPLSYPLRQTNIYSQLYSDSTLCTLAGFETSSKKQLAIDELSEFMEDVLFDLPKNQPKAPREEPQSEVKIKSQKIQIKDSLDKQPLKVIEEDSSAVARTHKKKELAAVKNITPIEDFSATSAEMNRFYDNLKNASSLSRPVRIAVLGDSFIEGDIFTQDLREMLQGRFSGRGVGFMPITSTVADFRKSVSHTFSNWSTRSVVTNVSRDDYIMSSFTYSPKASRSVVTYRASTSRRYLDSFSRARFLFRTKSAAKISVQINDNITQTFTPTGGERLSQVVVMADSINSVSFTIENGEGMTAYGVYLEDACGVNVDNYSVRGNSGTSLSSINEELTSQMGKMLPVDLVIFEYGLNVAQADVKSYKVYLSQMQRVVNHLKRCFPEAAILIMSIPDRTRRASQGWVTMPGVEAMARTQRDLARNTGVLYWSTLDAMRARGGMSKFVERGWAAKDHTHLSGKGGREIGRALFDALIYDMENR